MSLTPRNLFLLLGISFALIVVGFRLQLLFLERHHLLEQRQTQAASLARFGASYTARIYDSSSRLAREIAAHIDAEHPAPEALGAYLAARTADTTLNAYAVVFDANGHLVAASETVGNPGIVAAPGFAERMAGANRRVEQEARSRLTGAVIYPMTQRLTDANGGFAGLVSVNARPGNSRASAERRPEDPQLSVWTLDGKFIAAAFVDFDATGRAIAPKPPGGVGLPGAPTKADPGMLIAKSQVDGWPLVVVAAYDRAGVLTSWRRNVVENAALIAAVLAAVGALVWLGLRTAAREEEAKQGYLQAREIAEGALRDRELLLKEIHHRIKNSLLLTSSLIYLQARQFKDPEVQRAFEATQRRLSSIGLVHDALYSGDDFGEIDLSTYLTKLLQQVAAAYGAEARQVSIDLDIAPINVTADQVTPLGLIITEVLTNTFKHAFSPDHVGKVRVAAALRGGEVVVTVQDNGAGFDPSNLSAGGLGAKLIRSLSEQLGGSYTFVNDGGAVFTLRFPAITLGLTAIAAG
jgi:two-component sensor histidine kinase